MKVSLQVAVRPNEKESSGARDVLGRRCPGCVGAAVPGMCWGGGARDVLGRRCPRCVGAATRAFGKGVSEMLFPIFYFYVNVTLKEFNSF